MAGNSMYHEGNSIITGRRRVDLLCFHVLPMNISNVGSEHNHFLWKLNGGVNYGKKIL